VSAGLFVTVTARLGISRVYYTNISFYFCFMLQPAGGMVIVGDIVYEPTGLG
jgi:hypothetical protein